MLIKKPARARRSKNVVMCTRCGKHIAEWPGDGDDELCQECWEAFCSESWWVLCAPFWGEPPRAEVVGPVLKSAGR